MVNNRHSVSLRFLGGADGQVTPSSTLVSSIYRIKGETTKQVTRLLLDAGSTIREETRDAQEVRSIEIPKEKLNAIILTHAHTDHVGDLPSVVQAHPDVPIYAPEKNKGVMRRMIQEAYMRRKDREPLKEIEEWSKRMTEYIGEMEGLEKQLRVGIRRGRGGCRNATTKHHHDIGDSHDRISQELDVVEMKIWTGLGLTPHSAEEFAVFMGEEKFDMRKTIGAKELRRAVNKANEQRMSELGKQKNIITPLDVESAISKIQELQLKETHKITKIIDTKTTKKYIKATLLNSGHTITAPAAQVLLEIPTNDKKYINVLFSGDRGNSKLKPPYAQADDTGLEEKADVLVLESTYGDREHPEREKDLEKLDAIVLEAIKNKEDIIIPIISLDRPLVVMYEIVMRLVKTGKIKPEDVDIYHFGQMIAGFLSIAHSQPMLKEIKKYWKNWKALEPREIRNFYKPGPRSRIVFAGGGFLPKKGSPAGAILEYALELDELTILSANYHGDPGSNGYNMHAGKPFQLSKTNPEPHILRSKQKARYIPSFSGHEDGPGLVAYARKVIKPGGTIFLNHGSEKARKRLQCLLQNDPELRRKKVNVILPKAGNDYIVKKAKK